MILKMHFFYIIGSDANDREHDNRENDEDSTISSYIPGNIPARKRTLFPHSGMRNLI